MKDYDCLDDAYNLVIPPHEHLCGECRVFWVGWNCLNEACDLEPREAAVCPSCAAEGPDNALAEPVEKEGGAI